MELSPQIEETPLRILSSLLAFFACLNHITFQLSSPQTNERNNFFSKCIYLFAFSAAKLFGLDSHLQETERKHPRMCSVVSLWANLE